MSSVSTSRATLEDVIALISHANLSERQKQDLRSAVRSVVRLLGAEPASISAAPASLRRRIEAIAPEANGLSRGRRNNIRSLLAKALALARPILAGRSTEPILPEWDIFAVKLPFNRRVRLLALLRFLSAGKDTH